MPWSSAYLSWLSSGALTPQARLVFVDLPQSVTASPAGLSFSSHRRAGDIQAIVGFTCSEQALEPDQGRVTAGDWTVTLQGDLRGVLSGLRPGCWAELHLGDRRWPSSALEVQERGRLTSLQREGEADTITLVFEAQIVALQCRLTKDTGTPLSAADSEVPLFYRLRAHTHLLQLAADYTPGDSKLHCVVGPGDFAAFEREAGQTGLMLVEPLSGDSFYLEWYGSNTAAGRFSLSATGGMRGTTDAPALAGSTVKPVALMRGHPADIVRRILTSSGGMSHAYSGTAGPGGDHDVYPGSWGIDPNAALVDWLASADWDGWVDHVLVDDTGSRAGYAWELIAEEPAESGLEMWSAAAATAGLFLVTRQGEITIRSLQDMDPAGARQPNGLRESGLAITDEDIIEVIGWQGFDPGQQAAARLLDVLTGETATGRAFYRGVGLEMSPALAGIQRDLSSVLFASAGGNPYSAASATADRWLCWTALVRESIELIVSPRFAQATLCDVVRLTTDRLYGCLPETAFGYRDQPVAITAIQPRLLPGEQGAPGVYIRLTVLPVPTQEVT